MASRILFIRQWLVARCSALRPMRPRSVHKIVCFCGMLVGLIARRYAAETNRKAGGIPHDNGEAVAGAK
jgi:hypothetical protein